MSDSVNTLDVGDINFNNAPNREEKFIDAKRVFLTDAFLKAIKDKGLHISQFAAEGVDLNLVSKDINAEPIVLAGVGKNVSEFQIGSTGYALDYQTVVSENLDLNDLPAIKILSDERAARLNGADDQKVFKFKTSRVAYAEISPQNVTLRNTGRLNLDQPQDAVVATLDREQSIIDVNVSPDKFEIKGKGNATVYLNGVEQNFILNNSGHNDVMLTTGATIGEIKGSNKDNKIIISDEMLVGMGGTFVVAVEDNNLVVKHGGIKESDHTIMKLPISNFKEIQIGEHNVITYDVSKLQASGAVAIDALKLFHEGKDAGIISNAKGNTLLASGHEEVDFNTIKVPTIPVTVAGIGQNKASGTQTV